MSLFAGFSLTRVEGTFPSQTRAGCSVVWLSLDLKTKPKKRKQNVMRTTMKPIMYLQMTALFLAAALTGAVAAEREVPFRGTFEAVETPQLHFPTVSVEGSGTGNATQLGKFTVTYQAEVNLLTFVGIGSSEFTAANGDQVFADFVGHSTPTGTPNLISIVEVYTITGGTGRFADATGTFTLERLKDQVTGSTTGSFDGTIVIQE
jgi:hypothetical protein